MKKMKQNKTKIDFFEFSYLWFRLQGLDIPFHQKTMTKWLFNMWSKNDDRKALLMAFRNSGKSTIVGLFCSWVLYMDNSTRILVVAADYDLAKKMVRNVKKIIEHHPLTKSLKPRKIEQWASDQFTIIRDKELRDPSMLAKGLGGNITGLRADLIICDDVEVPKNCDSIVKRKDMREKLSELDYILTPNGMQLYIGTPHSFYTIYKNEMNEDSTENKPFLLGFEKLEIPILNSKGKSNWPKRFSEEKIASIRQRSGEGKFLSQMMLKPVNIADSMLNPDKLLIYDNKINVVFSNGQQVLKIGDKKMLSASCWWDPSFACSNKNDNSVVACVFSDDEGKFWLHDIEYIKVDEAENDDIATLQCEKIVGFLDRNCLPSIRVETNGIGKFLPGILKNTLKKHGLKTAVIDVSSHQNKETRIMEAFDVLLANRALKVHTKVWQTPFIEEMREWTPNGKNKDDALDAVAGCILSQPMRISNISLISNDMKEHNWQGGGIQFRANTFFDI